jgi:hypothetical protein
MKKYVELFAQGKPIHPYSLQCKAVSRILYRLAETSDLACCFHDFEEVGQ